MAHRMIIGGRIWAICTEHPQHESPLNVERYGLFWALKHRDIGTGRLKSRAQISPELLYVTEFMLYLDHFP